MDKTIEQEKKESRDEAYKDVKMYIANDWNLKEETPEFFVLTRNEGSTTGHVAVFLLTFWFTLGIGNVIYYFAKRKTKKILK
tara:strand:- start:2331 stop:2576 length:246 start_codon:yes stop_codon:yes gene_type:complete